MCPYRLRIIIIFLYNIIYVTKRVIMTPLIVPYIFSGNRRGIRSIEVKRIPVDMSRCHRSERQRKYGYLFFGQLCSAKLTDVDVHVLYCCFCY